MNDREYTDGSTTPTPSFFNRSNVYAVSRNIEDLDSAKMTPMMPNVIDANDEVVHMGPTVVRPESTEVE